MWAFGYAPLEGDDYKVDAEYCFENEKREQFFVYAYKATKLYDSRYPSPAKFWKSKDIFCFSVGGHAGSDVEGFIRWVKNKINMAKHDGIILRCGRCGNCEPMEFLLVAEKQVWWTPSDFEDGVLSLNAGFDHDDGIDNHRLQCERCQAEFPVPANIEIEFT